MPPGSRSPGWRLATIFGAMNGAHRNVGTGAGMEQLWSRRPPCLPSVQQSSGSARCPTPGPSKRSELESLPPGNLNMTGSVKAGCHFDARGATAHDMMTIGMATDLESMLLAPMRKIFLQPYRHFSGVSGAAALQQPFRQA